MSEEENEKLDPISTVTRILTGSPAEMMVRFTPMLFLLIVLAIIGFGAFGSSGAKPLLEQLSDRSTARGLITLLFAFGTIWIALLLAVSAVSSDKDDKHFNRGKEVLTILVGILGTIIGYYFGVESQQSTVEQSRLQNPISITSEEQIQNGTPVQLTPTEVPVPRQ